MCPSWCRYTAPNHSWAWDTPDGRPARDHLIGFGTVTPSLDTVANPARQPDVTVTLVQEEISGGERGPFLVALSADYYPHLTPDEARKVAAALTAAAARADEIAGR